MAAPDIALCTVCYKSLPVHIYTYRPTLLTLGHVGGKSWEGFWCRGYWFAYVPQLSLPPLLLLLSYRGLEDVSSRLGPCVAVTLNAN